MARITLHETREADRTTWIVRGTRKEERVTLKTLFEIYSLLKQTREDFFTAFLGFCSNDKN